MSKKVEKKYLENGLSKVLKNHNAQKRRVIIEKKADAQKKIDKSKVQVTLGSSKIQQDVDEQFQDVDYDASHLVQIKPEYEDYNVPDIKDWGDGTAFKKFAKECNQDIGSMIKSMDTMHIEFSVSMAKGKKEGKGSFRCHKTNDFYYGEW